jgi:hypothetical protein
MRIERVGVKGWRGTTVGKARNPKSEIRIASVTFDDGRGAA